MKKSLWIGLFLVSAWGSAAQALDVFNPSQISLFTDDRFPKALLRTTALGMDHRPYMPATPLGLVIGLDLGVTATVLSLPSEFVQGLSIASGTAETGVPKIVGLPQLAIRKGLPGGVDIGFSYVKLQEVARVYGGDIQWAMISGGGPKPAVAARLSYSSSKLWFMKTNTWSLDGVISKNLYLIDPYAGAGLKYWNGELEVPTGISLLPTVSATHSAINPHLFFGLPLKMAFLHVTFEADYNFGGVTTYGGKVSFNF